MGEEPQDLWRPFSCQMTYKIRPKHLNSSLARTNFLRPTLEKKVLCLAMPVLARFDK